MALPRETVEVITGQVPVVPPCSKHREVAHSAEGNRWCNRCGWTLDYNGLGLPERMAPPNGGWA